MYRPRSIVFFEIAYLAALAINILSPILIWSALTTSISERAQVGANAAGTVNGVLIGGLLVMAALGVLLWWFVARRGSNVARWIAAVLLAYSLFSSALGLARAPEFHLIQLLGLLAAVFTAVALATLFMPDARGWFAGDVAEPLEP